MKILLLTQNYSRHDDIIKRKHSVLLAICAGNSPVHRVIGWDIKMTSHPKSEFKCKFYKHLGSPNLATIAKFHEIVKIGGCTQLPTPWLQGYQPLETHFSNELLQFQHFCMILHKFQYFCAETTEKLRWISVFWPKFHENFSNKNMISVTKYWNSVTLGSPVVIETASAGGRSAWPARLGVHPIWWRWHGNTKSLSKVQSCDV